MSGANFRVRLRFPKLWASAGDYHTTFVKASRDGVETQVGGSASASTDARLIPWHWCEENAFLTICTPRMKKHYSSYIILLATLFPSHSECSAGMLRCLSYTGIDVKRRRRLFHELPTYRTSSAFRPIRTAAGRALMQTQLVIHAYLSRKAGSKFCF